MKRVNVLQLIAVTLLTGTPLVSHAAYSCSLDANGIGATFTSLLSAFDSRGSVNLKCTRALTDSATLTYRIKADNGSHWSTPNRRVKHATSNTYLNYTLNGPISGSTASCGNNSNWFAPATGTVGVVTGTLVFSTNSIHAAATVPYCVRLLGGQGTPAPGIYSDAINLTAQYPNSDAGALTNPETLRYSAGVGSLCIFSLLPSINASIDAFDDSTTGYPVKLRCSVGLPWTVSLAPTSGTLLGINYQLALSRGIMGTKVNTLTGTGTGNDDSFLVIFDVPGNQAGTCATSTCWASQQHTLLVTY